MKHCSSNLHPLPQEQGFTLSLDLVTRWPRTHVGPGILASSQAAGHETPLLLETQKDFNL